MLVTELLEETRARFDDAVFVELYLEDGKLIVYGYDEDLNLIRLREYEHFSDIRLIDYIDGGC